MTEYLLQRISLLAVFASCLLALFLLTVKTERRLPNRLFATFIILNAADLSSWMLNNFLSQYPRVLLFKITLNTLINPVFYLYIVAVCYADFRPKARHLLHLIPFGLLNGLLLPRFYLTNTSTQLHFLHYYSTMPEAVIGRVLGQLQFGLYAAASFWTLAWYQRTYVKTSADPSNETYRWLFRLTAVLTGLHCLVFGKELLRYTPYQPLFQGLEVWVGLTATILICWWLMQALHQPERFRSINSRMALFEPLLSTSPVAESVVSVHSEEGTYQSAEIQALVCRLRDHMVAVQPYLNPDLTIQDLAQQLQLPVRELSLLINHHLGQHFFDFVNEYRIHYAMRLLKDPTKRDQTVLEILYAVGFNSKSSFNTSFKKLTGQTPSQYRNA